MCKAGRAQLACGPNKATVQCAANCPHRRSSLRPLRSSLKVHKVAESTTSLLETVKAEVCGTVQPCAALRWGAALLDEASTACGTVQPWDGGQHCLIRLAQHVGLCSPGMGRSEQCCACHTPPSFVHAMYPRIPPCHVPLHLF